MNSKGFVGKILLDLFEVLFISLTVFVVVYFFVGQLLEVTGDSMYPNFKDKEQIIAEKVSYNFSDPQRGEVVIFKHPEQEDRLLIKRLIGLPGETIELKDGKVFIDGSELSEEYLNDKVSTEGGAELKENILYTIPQDQYVFMGDNRTQSTDSRAWGFISRDLIVGRAFLVYYPADEFRIIKK